jgi:hypothetical protein
LEGELKETNTPASDPGELLRQLTEAEWRDLWKRLLYYTIKNFGYVQQVGGTQVEDLIQSAILGSLSGVRTWLPPKPGVTKQGYLFTSLCSIIRSKASHLVKQRDKLVYLDERDNSDDIPIDQLHLEQRSIASDQNAIYNEFSENLLELVSDDLILTEVVKLLIEMPDIKPRDIAGILGLRIEVVQNAQKRLARRASILREKKK